MRNGQVFVLGALIFTGLLLLVFFSFGNIIQSAPQPEFRDYFQDSLEGNVKSFNKIYEQNSSHQYVKRKLYSYYRFKQFKAKEKGIDYTAVSFFILPEQGKAVLINYQKRKTDVNLKIGNSWHNYTLKKKQFNETGFSQRNPDIILDISQPKVNRNFTAYTPRLFAWNRMSTSTEEWKNQLLR